MKHRSTVKGAFFGWISFLGVTSLVTSTLGQAPPPPIPPPALDEEEDEEDEVGEDSAGDTPSTSSSANPPTQSEPSAEPWEQPVGDAAQVPAYHAADDTGDTEWFRTAALRRMTTLSGSTGLHRVSEASSGAPGTFRMNLLGSYFAKKGFLCRDNAPCTDRVTGEEVGEDLARHSSAILMISATPFPFLEAFFSIHNAATRNSNGRPEVLEIVGDTHMGLKVFLPEKPDRIFTFGGEADVQLLMGTGGVGPLGGATSLALRGLASMNLDNRTNEEDRLPLRAHVNLGYHIDNSSVVVRNLEQTARPEGRGAPVERTERYGLGISRVDAFQIGLGTEYIHDYVRPFVEWTIDVPVNRQAYVCNVQSAESRGDECLGVAAGFGTSPSRFTLGARAFPWQASGLSLTAALDIGTGGTRRFLEETTPEAPYSLWFGVGYAVDTVPPAPKTVSVPSAGGPEFRRYIAGIIVEETSRAVIPHALIRYDGVPMTGLVANADGQFISQDLPPGEYRFKIFAEQFREGTCSVVIPETAGEASAPADENGVGAPYMEDAYTMMVPVECPLKELPRVANVTGLLVDSLSGGPVPDAKVRITDTLNRSLELDVDASGSFQFRNVPFGDARLTVSAPGYLTTVLPIKIESREDLKPHVLMQARPRTFDLRVGRNEITLAKPIEFVPNSYEVTVDSMFMVEQLAAVLIENSKLEGIEIQVHTDDSGSASYSRRLSQQRADRIMDLLVQLGVTKRRLRARGYGPDQPLAPNVSDANRAMNNRVQVMID